MISFLALVLSMHSISSLFECHQHLTVIYSIQDKHVNKKMLPTNIWFIGHYNTMTLTMKISNEMNVIMNTVIKQYLSSMTDMTSVT